MSYVRTVFIVNEKTGRKLKRYELMCDQCGKLWNSGYKIERDTYCGNECRFESNRSGLIKMKRERTMVKNYGVVNPGSSKKIREKVKRTCEERYGVSNVSQVESVKQKKADTFMDHYGTTNNFGRPDVRQNVEKTLIERYGSKSASAHPDVKAKLNSSDVRAKRFASWVRNGSIKSSKPENELCRVLEQLYGDVQRHVTVNGWSIDAYVPLIDLYVQHDGTFWHWTERTRDELSSLAEQGLRVHQVILRKYDRDREQELWFSTHGMKLLRVKERTVNEAMKSDVGLQSTVKKMIDDLLVQHKAAENT